MAADQEKTAANPTPCGYCGAGPGRRLYPTTAREGDTFAFHACQRCQAVYLAPPPTQERLRAAYDTQYYGDNERKFVPLVEGVIDWFRSRRAARVAGKLPPGGRVLDIGCGNGGFLAGLANRGFTAHGVELPGRAAERAQSIPGVQVAVGELSPGLFPDNHFDAITLWHVFEHLTQPGKTLDMAAAMLKPGGRLYLSLPNVESWQCAWFRGYWLHHDPPRHLFYLGPRPLARELRARSFRLAASTTFSLEQNVFGFQQSFLNVIQSDRDVLYEALKGNPQVGLDHAPMSLFLQKVFFVVSFPFFAVLSLAESLAGKGGTMELEFVKEEA